ncbi:unnamed protein product [Notodromas monacha]|uniref:Ubiquitin carboxyl-terminal hydrolase n=1 Tax=Notodromas monacha TaxID=399045 RepID=A0A7R9G8Y7_9CRUS|nr:unnamed protein product [Notodromas monacha]CAG0912588.1 unnamed protein product [Notodromas monacha]
MPAIAMPSKYSSTYGSSYTHKFCSSSSSVGSLSSRSNSTYRALSLDRPSVSSSSPLRHRPAISTWTPTSSSTIDSRYPSVSTRLPARPPRPGETKHTYEPISTRKDRYGARDSLTSTSSSTLTSAYPRSRDSRLFTCTSYDARSSSRESSIARDSVSSLESWRSNRRERSTSRGTIKLDEDNAGHQVCGMLRCEAVTELRVLILTGAINLLSDLKISRCSLTTSCTHHRMNYIFISDRVRLQRFCLFSIQSMRTTIGAGASELVRKAIHSSTLSQDSGYNSWGRSSCEKLSTTSKYHPVEDEKPRLSISERKAALENSTKLRRGSGEDVRPVDDTNGNRPGGPSVKERTALLLDSNRNSSEKENEDDAKSCSSVSSSTSVSSVTPRGRSALSAKTIQRPFPRTKSPLINGFESDANDSPTNIELELARQFTNDCAILSKHPYLEKGGQSGLRNIGNTCFMNSIIQCLTYSQPLLEYVIEEKYLNEISSKSRMEGSIVKAFGSLVMELWRDKGSYVNPGHFKKCVAKFAPRFMGYDQQDAQEFLRYLLDGLHEDLNRVIIKPKPMDREVDSSLTDAQKAEAAWQQYLKFDNSRIVDIFVGQLKSTLTCTVCDHKSVTFDPFWDLSVSLPQALGLSECVDLTECLELFTKEEVLDGDEKVECSRCKKLVRATKKLTIQRYPKVLVLHLKRFGVDRFRGKLQQKVIYPLIGLNLAPYSSAGAMSTCGRAGIYNLCGVANHVGSLYRGHYTAFCRHPYLGQWFEFDDTMVSKMDSLGDIVSSSAYVLFYELSSGSYKHSSR